MPNTPVPAAAIGLPSSEPHGRIPAGAQANIIPADRRGFLKALAGIATLGSAAAIVNFAADPDPIFAAIDTHRKREAEFGDVCGLTDEVAAREQGREVTAEDEAAYEFASVRADDALYALAETVPLSIAGIRAVLTYFIEDLDLKWQPEDAVHACVRSVLASPVLSGGAHV